MFIMHAGDIIVLSRGMNSEHLGKDWTVNVDKVTQYSDGNNLYTSFLK